MIRVAIALLLLTSPAAAQQSVPVMLEAGDGQAASCGLGRVARLDPRGDGFLAVRSGPSTKNRKLDELHNGDEVSICDRRGRWWGIVYGRGDCNAEQARPRRVPYRGPCRTGWVSESFVDWIAP